MTFDTFSLIWNTSFCLSVCLFVYLNLSERLQHMVYKHDREKINWDFQTWSTSMTLDLDIFLLFVHKIHSWMSFLCCYWWIIESDKNSLSGSGNSRHRIGRLGIKLMQRTLSYLFSLCLSDKSHVSSTLSTLALFYLHVLGTIKAGSRSSHQERGSFQKQFFSSL